MRKCWKILLIAVVLVSIAMVSFLYEFGFPPFCRTVPLTVEERGSYRAFWVGKRVSVEGTITLDIQFIPEEVPPFNCLISSDHASFGVLWKNPDYRLDNQNVTVIGIVKYGTANRQDFAVSTYYLEAEKVFRTRRP
jgi:hypothetical protein